MDVKTSVYTDDGYKESTDSIENFIEINLSSGFDNALTGFGRLCEILASKGMLNADDIIKIANCYSDGAELIIGEGDMEEEYEEEQEEG